MAAKHAQLREELGELTGILKLQMKGTLSFGCSKILSFACDQQRPKCQRCQSRGVVCEGYAKRTVMLQWTTRGLERQPFETASRVPAASCERDVPSGQRPADRIDDVSARQPGLNPVETPSSITQWSPDERRSLEYFHARTCDQVSGLYPCEFWKIFILQQAHADKGTRHALVALSALHRNFESTGQVQEVLDGFAQRQYRLAIRTHIDGLATIGCLQNAEEVVKHLTCCIVFTCIEMLQGHYLSAISLIKGAVKLFYNLAPDYSTPSIWLQSLLESLIARLQAQVIGLLGDTATIGLVPPRLHPVSKAEMPVKFECITEARTHLDFFLYSRTLSTTKMTVSGCSDEARHAYRRQCLQYANTMTRWSSAFDALLDSLVESRMTAQETRALSILKIRRLMGLAILKMAFEHSYLPGDETLWDLYTPVWEEVISIAQSLQHTLSQEYSKQKHVFTLDSTLIAPLYEVARHCREPALRRRAIALLREHPTREGLWDSLIAAQAAERQIEIEEKAIKGPVVSAADIPRECRVVDLLPTFDESERKAVVRLRLPDQTFVEAQTQEPIKW